MSVAEVTTSWTGQQEQALDSIRRWATNSASPQVFRLYGYAGTGKTTIARDIYQEFNCMACAFTGKAASVMAAKGLSNASTVHRLIYTPVDKDATQLTELKEELETLEAIREPTHSVLRRLDAVRRAVREASAALRQPAFTLKEMSDISSADIVVLDEASMVDSRMGEDLLSFGTKVLVIGDPAQLPPVKGAGYFMAKGSRPDAMLTEIHRQAADNPIIRLSQEVREGRSLRLGDYGAVKIVSRVDPEVAMAADQVLCGLNKKRRAINTRHRQLGGHLDLGPYPQAGERLVCLRNNHDIGVLNGTLWDVLSSTEPPEDDFVDLHVRADVGGVELAFPAHARIFLDDEDLPQWGGSNGEWFTYGYCLTVHKSQGSEWDNVVLFNDWFNRDSHKAWLYTGVTRAAEELTVVQC